jgi:hypothetical protein
VRRWRDGVIPDVAEAVASPQLLTDDPSQAQRLLDLVPDVPTAVWGRDELDAGEMWNSNSLTSWLIESSGLDAETIQPPVGGRAPGWDAGLVVARRQSRNKTKPRSHRSPRRSGPCWTRTSDLGINSPLQRTRPAYVQLTNLRESAVP